LIETVVILTLPALALGGLVAALGWQQRSELSQAWLAAAAACGLEEVTLRRDVSWGLHLQGRRGRLEVRLLFVRAEDLVRPGTRIVVEGLPPELELRRTDTPEPFGRRRTGLPTGDDTFDAMLSVDGNRRHVLAVLDAATRDLAREIFADRKMGQAFLAPSGTLPPVHLRHGRLDVACYQGREPHLERLLGRVLAFAEALAPSGALEPRLAANVRLDPEPSVRLANLRELLAETRRHPATREALRAALADGDEQVQLEAAIALGSEGREVLLQIASREWSADACAARAVEELRAVLPAGQARDILAYALRTRRRETARACVESLSRRGTEDVDTFARVLALESGSLAAEAARALGRVAGIAAVPALLDAQRRLDGDEGARLAIREAIAAIQARTSGALPGQLTLADDQGGRVSLPLDEEGRVSLASRLEPPPRRS
jgi:hypothetical protein